MLILKSQKMKKQILKHQNKLLPLRQLEDWILYKVSNDEFLVKSPNESLESFTKKSDAERHMLYGFFNQHSRPFHKVAKTTSKKVKKKSTPKNMESMTDKRIMTMSILDSEKKIRFLYDYNTQNYIVFNGALNQTHFAQSFQKAERYFNHLVDIS